MKRRKKKAKKSKKKHVLKPVKPLSDTMRRSVKLYPAFTPKEREAIMGTMELYEEAFDDFSSYCVYHRTTDRKELQSRMYPYFRALHPEFPSALLQSVRDQATEGIKSFNSNNPGKRYRVAPRLRGNCTMRYTLRAASLRGNLLTLSTVKERIRKVIKIPEFFRERYLSDGSWKFNSALIGIDFKGRIYVTFVFTKKAPALAELPEEPEELEKITMGYDRGTKYHLAGSDGKKQDSKKISAVKRRYAHNRETCQKKGTRSAKRRLKALSGKEARFVRNENHCMSKKAASGPERVHVFENLSGMNEQKKKGNKGKKTRSLLSNWSYSQLEYDVRYKDQALGKHTVFVDPAYTSQECSNCGNIDKNARKKGEYHCRKCGMRMHADTNAAKVIKKRWLEKNTRLLAAKGSLKDGQAAVILPREPSGHPANGWSAGAIPQACLEGKAPGQHSCPSL